MPTVEVLRPKRRIIPLPSEAVPAHRHKAARAYLSSRGLSTDAMQRFALLYCPDGYFSQRVIVPICDRRGNYRSFAARAINPAVTPKYLYPKFSSTSSMLYNLHFIKQTNRVMLVEGVFDSIHLESRAVASFGKQVSQAQINQLRLHGITHVTLLWDAEAWQNTPNLWARAVRRLSEYFFTFQIKLPHSTPTEFSLDEILKIGRWGCNL